MTAHSRDRSAQTSNGVMLVVLERDAGAARLRATAAVRCAALSIRFEIIACCVFVPVHVCSE